MARSNEKKTEANELHPRNRSRSGRTGPRAMDPSRQENRWTGPRSHRIRPRPVFRMPAVVPATAALQESRIRIPRGRSGHQGFPWTAVRGMQRVGKSDGHPRSVAGRQQLRIRPQPMPFGVSHRMFHRCLQRWRRQTRDAALHGLVLPGRHRPLHHRCPVPQRRGAGVFVIGIRRIPGSRHRRWTRLGRCA